jgi:hypothetical protein
MRVALSILAVGHQPVVELALLGRQRMELVPRLYSGLDGRRRVSGS